MSKVEISLVLSARSDFDPNDISRVIRLRPYKVWRRKPGLVVDGVDNIPAMSWIFEAASGLLHDAQPFFDETLVTILACRDGILEAIDTHELSGTIICRVQAERASLAIEARPELLGALARCKCGFQLDIENEAAREGKTGAEPLSAADATHG